MHVRKISQYLALLLLSLTYASILQGDDEDAFTSKKAYLKDKHGTHFFFEKPIGQETMYLSPYTEEERYTYPKSTKSQVEKKSYFPEQSEEKQEMPSLSHQAQERPSPEVPIVPEAIVKPKALLKSYQKEKERLDASYVETEERIYAPNDYEIYDPNPEPCHMVPKRSDIIPHSSTEEINDCFLEGYLQALIDLHYYEYKVQVAVDGDNAYLSNLPSNKLLADSIMNFIADHPLVQCVYPVQDCQKRGSTPDDCMDTYSVPSFIEAEDIWFPQNTILFQPFVADPRQITYSVAYRFDDDALNTNVIAVSFGDQLPIYRWRNVTRWCGDMQIELEAGVWAEFDSTEKSADLINSDWYVAPVMTFALEQWSFRFRISHISSHLGDEFIVKQIQENPNFTRLNPSREAVDFFAAHQLTNSIRYYGGIGWIFHRDSTFEMEAFYVEYGAELRLLGCRNRCLGLYGSPFLAMHFRNWTDPNTDKPDMNRTFALGYEWSKLSGVGRKMRLFFEYHEGFSLEGQFQRTETNYLAIKFAYGF
jgi:hypothetical protein